MEEKEVLTRVAAPGTLFLAYCSGAAGAFFAGDVRDAATRGRAVTRAARPLAPDVADALEAQQARFAPAPARTAHLAALRRGAAAVVTGQQCGLFLGPLFTLYKAASAVAAARALAAESGRPVVPVFWVQNEDHDLPEIAVCQVPRARGGPLTLRLPASPAERVSVAHRTLPAAVTAVLAELRAELGNLPHAAAHLDRLARHYRPGTGWSDAFAATLAELFADDGLVLLDARDPAFARAAVPLHRRALADAPALAAALAARGDALRAGGYEPTVHVRPDAPLSFFHPEGAEGPRFRLEPTAGGGLAEVGGTRTHTRAALLAALDADPRTFSTSALLRPILQDQLLPTAAYVAGPAEVAYFAQLAPLYAAFDLAMPLVVPRARFRMLEERTLGLCARLGLSPDDADRPLEALLAAATRGTSDEPDESAEPAGPALMRALVDPFAAGLATLRDRLESLDSGLDTAIEKTLGSVTHAVGKLARKIEHARAHRDHDRVAAVEQVRAALAPDGIPQERVYGLAYFAARYGERAFVARVVDRIAPFDPAPVDLVWPAPAEDAERTDMGCG